MKRSLTLAGLGMAAVVLTACRSSPKSVLVGVPNTFTFSEFSIAAPSQTLRTGRVTITTDTAGRGDAHMRPI